MKHLLVLLKTEGDVYEVSRVLGCSRYMTDYGLISLNKTQLKANFVKRRLEKRAVAAGSNFTIDCYFSICLLFLFFFDNMKGLCLTKSGK